MTTSDRRTEFDYTIIDWVGLNWKYFSEDRLTLSKFDRNIFQLDSYRVHIKLYSHVSLIRSSKF